jgi:hypothetical protein
MTKKQQGGHPVPRSTTDRRRVSLGGLIYGAWRGRRVEERRAGTPAGYVDRYPTSIFLAAVALFLLAICDAFGTLVLLAHGAHEANPVMDALLRVKPDWFVSVKLTITALGVLVLVLHKNFSVLGGVSTVKILYGLVGIYGCLIAYQSVLIRSL